MNEIINIEHNNERVLTTEQLAQAYGCETKRISENFNRNVERFEEGQHYFKLGGEALKEFKMTNPQIAEQSLRAPVMYLWTRRGASRHSKMLGTDKAWEMFDALEENYFNQHPKELTPAEQMARGLLAAQKLLDTAKLELAQSKQIINELQPKADYVDTILQNKGLVTITQIAKDYGMSGREMNAKLHDLKIQYKQSGQWLLYSNYQTFGYTHSETIDIIRSDGRPDVTMETKWTQKGRLFLYDLLKDNGIVPVIERKEAA